MSKEPQKIRAIIVDDELHARENLRLMLEENCPEIDVLATADGAESAEALFRKELPELIFLDIRMPSGMEGFDLIDRIRDHLFYVVFVTAFKEHAIRAFESRALHYILKPIEVDDLRETVDRILRRRELHSEDPSAKAEYQQNLKRLEDEIARQNRPKRIIINHQRGVKIIDPADLSHLEGKGNCTLLHFHDGTNYLDTRTLKIYELLLSDLFFRIHRSYIVNLTEVAELLHGNDQSVILKNGIFLPVSRERKGKMLEELQRLIW